VSYNCYRISLIVLAKCIIALSFSTSVESRKAYCICIRLIAAIVLHPHKTLLCSFLDVWLTIFVKLVPCMNRAFFLDSDPLMSLRSSRNRPRTTKWDMTAEHALSYLCDELKLSVYKSGHLDDATEIDSQLNSSQDDVAGSTKPLQAQINFRLVCQPYLQSPEPSSHPHRLCYRRASPLTIYSTLPTLV